jgi:flagellar basal body L-ring protein FlgH
VKARIIVLFAAMLALSGCAQMLGRLRADLNDDQGSYSPTVGGAYPERGYLEEERYIPSPGHYDRSPAALRSASNEDTWSESREDRDGQQQVYEDRESNGQEAEYIAPRPPRRATRNDFIDQAQDSGSLWASNGESNFFFSKNRSRSPGDIVTITIEDEMLRDIQAEVKRTLTGAERRRELDLLEAKYAQGSAKASGGASQDQIKTTAAAPEAPDLSFGAVDVSSVVSVKASDNFLAEIVERFPNGNYKIKGSKRVPYRNTTKLMTLVGIVRGNDLGDEKVPSGKIYEYRLQIVR